MNPLTEQDCKAWRAHMSRAARRGCDAAVRAMHEARIMAAPPEKGRPATLTRTHDATGAFVWWLVSDGRRYLVMRTAEPKPEAAS